MMFLLALRGHWQALGIMLVIILVFFSGWHLRGISIDAKLYKESDKLIITANKVSNNYELANTEINKIYDNLNTKVTYENTYSCIIPADGLRLLSEATH